jgi:hypothetical protein
VSVCKPRKAGSTSLVGRQARGPRSRGLRQLRLPASLVSSRSPGGTTPEPHHPRASRLSRTPKCSSDRSSSIPPSNGPHIEAAPKLAEPWGVGGLGRGSERANTSETKSVRPHPPRAQQNQRSRSWIPRPRGTKNIDGFRASGRAQENHRWGKTQQGGPLESPRKSGPGGGVVHRKPCSCRHLEDPHPMGHPV